MNKETLKTIGIYSAIGLGIVAVSAIVVSQVRKARFSGKGRKEGSDVGLGNINNPVGKTLQTTSAIAYLREKPEIPSCAWYDVTCDRQANVVASIRGDVGGVKIKEVVVGKDGWDWYYLENVVIPKSPVNFTEKKVNGYVREDVVKVNF